MSASSNSRGKVLVIAAVAALVLGAGAWAYTSRSKAPEPPKVVTADEVHKSFEQMRAIRERKDLTEAERDKLREANGRTMEAFMDQQIAAWYAAPTPQAKKAVLDKNIDEMEKRRKEWESRPRDTSASQPSSRPSRRGFGGTPAERKSRSESRSPARMARMMEYWRATQDRMKERGIQPPRWGPGGGRGGPGGGPGGPHRG